MRGGPAEGPAAVAGDDLGGGLGLCDDGGIAAVEFEKERRGFRVA